MVNTFFTGCTHFDHANIIRLANRPFATVEDMNEAMIDRWNAKVRRGDLVYHLGDFGFIKNPDRAVAILSRLNGTVCLVHGNHDAAHIRRLPNFGASLPYMEIETGSEKLVLFHYPIEEWAGFFRGVLHLHCHTHQQDRKGKVAIPNRVNVTVEAWDYAPAALEDVKQVWAKERLT
ncbi:MAG: metallophosphoesterase family protein [Mesorhizobium sp.]|nr:metallophosphoesterase [Mesorhizobium sp.]MCO5159675.1 metallophosphoesterase family protein [Mesorhizobium sp.]